MSKDKKYSNVDHFIGAAPKAKILALSNPKASLTHFRIKNLENE